MHSRLLLEFEPLMVVRCVRGRQNDGARGTDSGLRAAPAADVANVDRRRLLQLITEGIHRALLHKRTRSEQPARLAFRVLVDDRASLRMIMTHHVRSEEGLSSQNRTAASTQ